MTIQDTSICIICGKQRIVVATHEEKVGTSTVIYKETMCPDPECQKKVEKILAGELAKRHQSILNQKLRIAGRKTGNHTGIRIGPKAE